MANKKILYWVILGVVSVVLICVLIAFLVDGSLPWDKDPYGDYTGITATTAPETTDETTEANGTEATGPKNEVHTDIEIGIEDDDDKGGKDDDDDFGVIDFDDLESGNFPTQPNVGDEEEEEEEEQEEVVEEEEEEEEEEEPTEPTEKPAGNGGAAVEEEGDLSFDFD